MERARDARAPGGTRHRADWLESARGAATPAAGRARWVASLVYGRLYWPQGDIVSVEGLSYAYPAYPGPN